MFTMVHGFLRLAVRCDALACAFELAQQGPANVDLRTSTPSGGPSRFIDGGFLAILSAVLTYGWDYVTLTSFQPIVVTLLGRASAGRAAPRVTVRWC